MPRDRSRHGTTRPHFGHRPGPRSSCAPVTRKDLGKISLDGELAPLLWGKSTGTGKLSAKYGVRHPAGRPTAVEAGLRSAHGANVYELKCQGLRFEVPGPRVARFATHPKGGQGPCPFNRCKRSRQVTDACPTFHNINDSRARKIPERILLAETSCAWRRVCAAAPQAGHDHVN